MNSITTHRRLAYRAALRLRSVTSAPVRQALRLLRQGDRATLHELRTIRDEAFVQLVQHAYHNVPYYHRVMEERGIHPDQVESLDDLARFPVLTKEVIRSEGSDLRTTGLDTSKTLMRRSGGTTGEPISSYVSPLARALETYSSLRGWEWMGWKPGLRMVELFGGTLGRPDPTSIYQRLKAAAMGSTFLPAFELSQANVPNYIQAIERAGPCILLGYASALFNLACLAEECQGSRLSVQQVLSTAEVLPPDWADRISRVFSCPVKSFYGFGEVNSLGYQVEEDGPYLVPDEHVVVEAVNTSSGPHAALNSSLLVTPLYNYAQPLIRYEAGDYGEVVPPGIAHPTRSAIDPLVGRSADMFLRADGSQVSSSLGAHTILITKLPVKRYQFIQWDRERIEFRYDPESEVAPEKLDEVAAILRRHIGDGTKVEFRSTTDFLLSEQNKHRIMIRKFE